MKRKCDVCQSWSWLEGQWLPINFKIEDNTKWIYACPLCLISWNEQRKWQLEKHQS